jgi:hypothetical protein
VSDGKLKITRARLVGDGERCPCCGGPWDPTGIAGCWWAITWPDGTAPSSCSGKAGDRKPLESS